MPLTFLQPGSDVLAALARDLSQAVPVEPKFALSHPIYTMAVEDVRQGLWRPIGPIGMKVLEVSGTAVVSAYEVAAGPDGMPQVSHRNVEGGYLRGAVDAVENAERVAADRTFEFRLLRVPFLHLAAVWLHDPNATGSDLILPMAPYPEPFEARKEWTPEATIATLMEFASEMDRRASEQNLSKRNRSSDD